MQIQQMLFSIESESKTIRLDSCGRIIAATPEQVRNIEYSRRARDKRLAFAESHKHRKVTLKERIKHGLVDISIPL